MIARSHSLSSLPPDLSPSIPSPGQGHRVTGLPLQERLHYLRQPATQWRDVSTGGHISIFQLFSSFLLILLLDFEDFEKCFFTLSLWYYVWLFWQPPLQALSGFLMILDCSGELFFATHSIETYLGFHQVLWQWHHMMFTLHDAYMTWCSHYMTLTWHEAYITWRLHDMTLTSYDAHITWRLHDMTLTWHDVHITRRSHDMTLTWHDVHITWRLHDSLQHK